jgi:hypothetical protein
MRTRRTGHLISSVLCLLLSACGSHPDAAPADAVRQTHQAVTLNNPVGEIQAFAGDLNGARGFSPSGTAAADEFAIAPIERET